MSSLSGKKILIVDDEPLMRAVLDEYLGSFGSQVSVVCSGNEAYSLLERERFDVVLSDVRMPDGDGLSLMRRVVSSLPSPPKVFFYTGCIETELETEASELGVVEIFRKPCELEQISTSISKVMGVLPQ